jgi:hypothetical protein
MPELTTQVRAALVRLESAINALTDAVDSLKVAVVSFTDAVDRTNTALQEPTSPRRKEHVNGKQR